jgi:CRP-like cAMP-binding protein
MNRLIETLSPDARALMERDFEHVELKRRDVLYGAGSAVEHVYFPTTGLVSIVVTMLSGRTAETSIVGQDGMVCSAIVFDVNIALDEATVEVAGTGVRIQTRKFIAAYQQNEHLRNVINRYHALMLAEARQSVACNALHPAEKRLCRLIADAQDRTGQRELALTQEFLSAMLGLRRSTVTQLYPDLQDVGIMSNKRGMITILDPDALRAGACECYGIIKKRSAEVFPEWDSLGPSKQVSG